MKKQILRFGSLLMVLALAACGSSSAGKEEESKLEEVTSDVAEESTEPEKTEEKEEASPYYFKDLEVVTEDYSIKITDWKIIAPGDEGNSYGDSPVIAFWYDTTNTSGKDVDPMSAWIYIMTAVQDNDPNMVNELDVAALPDSSFSDSQIASIKAGGTVANAVAYELTDTETPVELTATNGMFGDEIGKQVFEIK